MRRVVCAANQHRETGVIICGARHFDSIMRAQMNATGGFPFWNNCDQGFIDQRGVFLTRPDARRLAVEAGQIIRRCGGDSVKLYSENLY